jgi:hypothetical protein
MALEMRAGRVSGTGGGMRTKEHRVELTDEERAELFVLIRRGKAPARTLTRAHILLRASEDTYDWATAEALHVSRATVERVRRRFAEAPPGERLTRALYDAPRPGAAPKLDAKAEARLVALACTAPPDKRTVWTMQLLADKLVELHVIEQISDETVRRTLGKKQAQAVAEGALVPAGDGRRVRRGHGGRARPVR